MRSLCRNRCRCSSSRNICPVNALKCKGNLDIELTGWSSEFCIRCFALNCLIQRIWRCLIFRSISIGDHELVICALLKTTLCRKIHISCDLLAVYLDRRCLCFNCTVDIILYDIGSDVKHVEIAFLILTKIKILDGYGVLAVCRHYCIGYGCALNEFGLLSTSLIQSTLLVALGVQGRTVTYFVDVHIVVCRSFLALCL